MLPAAVARSLSDEMLFTSGWRRGVVVGVVRRMNEVNPRRARLVPVWSSGGSSPYVISQGGKLSLASLWGRLIEYQLWLRLRAGMSPLPGGR